MGSDFLYLKEIINTAQQQGLLSRRVQDIILGQIFWAYRRGDIGFEQVQDLYALAGVDIFDTEISEALEIATFGDIDVQPA
jgi:hypothetical protein